MIAFLLATGYAVKPEASLGAMLYEMVTGRPPFLGDDSVAAVPIYQLLGGKLNRCAVYSPRMV